MIKAYQIRQVNLSQLEVLQDLINLPPIIPAHLLSILEIPCHLTVDFLKDTDLFLNQALLSLKVDVTPLHLLSFVLHFLFLTLELSLVRLYLLPHSAQLLLLLLKLVRIVLVLIKYLL